MLEVYSILNIFCVGSNCLIGDSYGPVIGTYLYRKYSNSCYKDIVCVYGNEEIPLTYQMLKKKKLSIQNKMLNEDCIFIDSGLNTIDNIGNVLLYKNDICFGKALDKSFGLKSKMNLVGVVGENKNNRFQNFLILRNVEIEAIDRLVEISKIKMDVLFNQYLEYINV